MLIIIGVERLKEYDNSSTGMCRSSLIFTQTISFRELTKTKPQNQDNTRSVSRPELGTLTGQYYRGVGGMEALSDCGI